MKRPCDHLDPHEHINGACVNAFASVIFQIDKGRFIDIDADILGNGKNPPLVHPVFKWMWSCEAWQDGDKVTVKFITPPIAIAKGPDGKWPRLTQFAGK